MNAVNYDKITVSELVQELNDEVINTDFFAQRNNEQWSVLQKSLLIHSIMADYPIPPLYVFKKHMEEEKCMLYDGLQRVTAILDFKQDKLKLSKDTPPIDYQFIIKKQTIKGIMDIANKTYSEIENLEHGERFLQSCFLNKKMSIANTVCVDDAVRAEIFKRLNSGTQISATQKRMSSLSKDTNRIIGNIAKLDVFTKYIDMNRTQKRSDEPKRIIIIISMLKSNDAPADFTKKSLDKFASTLKSKTEVLNNMYDDIKKLGENFPDGTHKIKGFKPLHLVPFVLNMDTAKEYSVSISEYAQWIVDLYAESDKLTDEFKNTKNSTSKNDIIKKVDFIRAGIIKYSEEKIS